MSNKLIGYNGDILWQDDFVADSTSCSQSYIVSMDKFEIPAQNYRSDKMNVYPWSQMRNQSIRVKQWESNILIVNISYGYGNVSDGSDDNEDIRLDQLSIQHTKQSAQDNILAHPILRTSGAGQDELLFLALFANGQIVKAANGKYRYAHESVRLDGQIDGPASATAKEFLQRISQGEKSFEYSDESISYSYRTKKPPMQVADSVGYIPPELPKMITLPDYEDTYDEKYSSLRNWMITNFSVSYSGQGYYDVNITCKLSNYGGFDSFLYTKTIEK